MKSVLLKYAKLASFDSDDNGWPHVDLEDADIDLLYERTKSFIVSGCRLTGAEAAGLTSIEKVVLEEVSEEVLRENMILQAWANQGEFGQKLLMQKHRKEMADPYEADKRKKKIDFLKTIAVKRTQQALNEEEK